MKTIGNIIWVIFGGFIAAIMLFLFGIIYCVTIIGIPIGLQLFKVSKFVLWPFGKHVENTSGNALKAVFNVIWAILGGFINALMYLFLGVIYCITIIGIPFGLQWFKLARFILAPFGKTFVKN